MKSGKKRKVWVGWIGSRNSPTTTFYKHGGWIRFCDYVSEYPYPEDFLTKKIRITVEEL